MQLGNLIAWLEQQDPCTIITDGFGRPHIDYGCYEDLAFDPLPKTTFAEMLAHAKYALNNAFEGPKRGKYYMQECAECFIGEFGECGEEITSAHIKLWLLTSHKKSLRGWEEEFYPIAAEDVKGGNKELLEHALKKWKGATKENTEKYNCYYEDCEIIGKSAPYTKNFCFGVSTCALCLHYKFDDDNASTCENCPIVLHGGVPCMYEGSAYVKSIDDPLPMIALLEELLEKETNSHKGEK